MICSWLAHRWNSRPRCGVASLLVLVAACGESAADPAYAVINPVDWHSGTGVSQHLAEHAAQLLPAAPPELVEEVAELLDSLAVGGNLARRAGARLQDLEADLRSVALLSLVEDRLTELGVRRFAYAWLRDTGIEAMLPRLCLRLKYEKDSWSAVCIAHTLLLHGNGAGLEALDNLLRQEQQDGSLQTARAYADEVLALLPTWSDQAPPQDFAARWEHLQEVRGRWASQRLLTPEEEQPETFAPRLEAELWRFMAQFLSQPLRPVDDARFVLMRQRACSVPLLLAAAEDPDRYVREHALQTMAWIGPAVGHWCRAHALDLGAALERALQDPALRPRALEALGASGMAELGSLIAPFLSGDSFEERTAAANALLRCAGSDHLDLVTRALEDPQWPRLSNEARFSLWTLRLALQPEVESEYPVELWDAVPETERARRQRWSQERASRVNS